MLTVTVTLLFATYLLVGPVDWLSSLMQLTEMSTNFKGFIVLIAVAGLITSVFLERFVLPQLAKTIGRVKLALRPSSRKRKLYKLLEEEMRI